MVKNAGDEPVTIADLVLGGAQKAELAIVSSNCPKAALAPGASCTVVVRGTPAGGGARTGSLLVTTTTKERASVSIRWSAMPGTLAITPPTVDFGTFDNGTAAPARPAQVTNTGKVPVIISRFDRSDAAVTVAQACIGKRLDPGQSCPFTVRDDRTSARWCGRRRGRRRQRRREGVDAAAHHRAPEGDDGPRVGPADDPTCRCGRADHGAARGPCPSRRRCSSCGRQPARSGSRPWRWARTSRRTPTSSWCGEGGITAGTVRTDANGSFQKSVIALPGMRVGPTTMTGTPAVGGAAASAPYLLIYATFQPQSSRRNIVTRG